MFSLKVDDCVIKQNSLRMNVLFYEDDVLMLKGKIQKIAKKNFQNGQLFIISRRINLKLLAV